jgi:hypothetical protein
MPGLTRFEAIFFESNFSCLNGDKQPRLCPRDAPNVERAAQALVKIEPGGGTSPGPPLLSALALKPDAVVFLTDGEIHPSELDVPKVLAAAGGRTKIHTVLFGPAAQKDAPSLVEQLSKQSGGSHTYVCVD